MIIVSVCLPSDALLQHLLSTWVSLTLDVGYLFTAAPAKHSRCSLPWTRVISSWPPLLTLNVESEEELKSLLIKVKEESEKGGLKLNIQKTKIMASDPISSWQIDGEKIETVTDFINFIFLGSKITADGYSSLEIKRQMLLGRKTMTNLDSILKSRYYFAKKNSV